MTDIRNIMAVREAILQRNSALRGFTQSPGLDGPGTAAGSSPFASALAQVQAQSAPPPTQAVSAISSIEQGDPMEGFRSTLSNLLGRANTYHEQEEAANEAYEKGETTDLVAVTLQRQKADVTFEATLQIRNKLLSAYTDIMNIQL